MKPLAEETEKEYQSGDCTYIVLEDGTAEITLYTGEASELSIPDAIDGRAVSSIGVAAFNWSENLTSVIIPKGISNIGAAAFVNCFGFKKHNHPR